MPHLHAGPVLCMHVSIRQGYQACSAFYRLPVTERGRTGCLARHAGSAACGIPRLFDCATHPHPPQTLLRTHAALVGAPRSSAATET
jgi:hypothetical protein